jgi:hypothetical protein
LRQARIARLSQKNEQLVQDFARLGPDEQHQFYIDNVQLKGSELAGNMELAIKFTKEDKNTAYVKDGGKYYPLSVYSSRGYSAAALKNIEQRAASKFDAILGESVYKVEISEEGSIKEDVRSQQRTVSTPAAKPLVRRRSDPVDAADRTGGKDGGKKRVKDGKRSIDEGIDGEDGKKVKKNKGPNFKAAAKNLVAGFAPVLSTLIFVIKEKFTQQAQERNAITLNRGAPAL